MASRWADTFGSEFSYICKLGGCLADPEEKKAFWETVKAKKLADRSWSIYQDYPRPEGSIKRAMQECVGSILKRKILHEEKPEAKAQTAIQEFFGELIDLGGHKVELCLWPKREIA